MKSTFNSIVNNYGTRNVVCAVPENFQETEVYSKICRTVAGENTITSLINVGFHQALGEWNLLVMEGSYVKPNIDRKYSIFLKSDKDVMFPVVCDYDLQGNPSNIFKEFRNCSLNGILINRNTFLKVGDFSDCMLEDSRMMWQILAEQHGCSFKAILGAKIC